MYIDCLYHTLIRTNEYMYTDITFIYIVTYRPMGPGVFSTNFVKSFIICYTHVTLIKYLLTYLLFKVVVQFLLLPQCFPLFVIGYPFKYIPCFVKICSKSSAAELLYNYPYPSYRRFLTPLRQTAF